MVELRFSYFTPKWTIYREVARMGIPTFLRASLMTTSTVVINNFAGSFGDSALAAVSVANKCTRLVGSAIMGFGQGFQPVAGYCWGAGRYHRVNRAFWVSTGIGAVMAVVIGGVMGLFAPQLVAVFAAEDAEIVRLGTLMIRTQCVTMFAHVWVMIINGARSGAARGDPRAVAPGDLPDPGGHRPLAALRRERPRRQPGHLRPAQHGHRHPHGRKDHAGDQKTGRDGGGFS